MKNDQQRTTEEFRELQMELQKAVDEEKGAALPALIAIEEEWFLALARRHDEGARTMLEDVKRSLVSKLIRYGGYMKSIYIKDEKAAQKALGKAIRYDRFHPHAYYQLGITSYRHKNYMTAAAHFHNALKSNQKIQRQDISLTAIQEYYASLYLQNSSLYIAGEAANIRNQAEKVMKKAASHYQLNDSATISENESYLEKTACIFRTATSEELCSYDEAINRLHKARKTTTLILSRTERQLSVYYHDHEVKLSYLQNELLEGMLGKMNGFSHLFWSRDEHGHVPEDIISQAKARLSRKLSQAKIPSTEEDLMSTPYIIIEHADQL